MKLSHKYKTKKNKKKKFKINGGEKRTFSEFGEFGQFGQNIHADDKYLRFKRPHLSKLTRQNDINHYETTQPSEQEPAQAQESVTTKRKDVSQTSESSINSCCIDDHTSFLCLSHCFFNCFAR